MLTPKASAVYSNQIRIHNNNTHTHLSFSLAAQVLLTNPVLVLVALSLVLFFFNRLGFGFSFYFFMCSCLFELLALFIYTYITTFTATDQCEVTCFLLLGSCVSNPSCLLYCLHRSIDANLFLVQFIWFIHNDKSNCVRFLHYYYYYYYYFTFLKMGLLKKNCI